MVKKILLASVFILAVFHFFGCGEIITGPMNSLALSWTAPTTNEDETELEDLCGYMIYYGNESSNYFRTMNVFAYHTNAVVSDLGPGTWYLSVTAYDFYGNESDFSNEVVHTFE